MAQTPSFELTAKQEEANRLLAGSATHVMLFGGSRSGKTFLLCRAIAIRALKAERSRHAILRYRFNHVKASVWHDTWPKMMRLCFPDVPQKADKQDFFIRLPNGSEIWFGGLDEKERTEKILGQEYATVFLNECSQISYPSVEVVRTRLAQKTDLRLKAYYDCNPPLASHWTYKVFVQGMHPAPGAGALSNPDDYTALQLNPRDNEANLPEQTLKELQSLGAKAKQRFWLGEWGSAAENALWTYEVIEKGRRDSHPDLQRVVVSVDPSGTKGEEDERSDHVGIVVVGLGIDGEAYVLEDLTVKAGPAVWGKAVVAAYERHSADSVIGEVNYGGAMVQHVIQSAASEARLRVPYREVHASRGKVVRAEPVATLYEQGKVHHVGVHAELEDQLCAMTTAGYMGDRSPDRADALIWGLSDLFPGLTRKAGPDVASLPTQANNRYSPHRWRQAREAR